MFSKCVLSHLVLVHCCALANCKTLNIPFVRSLKSLFNYNFLDLRISLHFTAAWVRRERERGREKEGGGGGLTMHCGSKCWLLGVKGLNRNNMFFGCFWRQGKEENSWLEVGWWKGPKQIMDLNKSQNAMVHKSIFYL